jgi:hypothetical protein
VGEAFAKGNKLQLDLGELWLNSASAFNYRAKRKFEELISEIAFFTDELNNLVFYAQETVERNVSEETRKLNNYGEKYLEPIFIDLNAAPDFYEEFSNYLDILSKLDIHRRNLELMREMFRPYMNFYMKGEDSEFATRMENIFLQLEQLHPEV